MGFYAFKLCEEDHLNALHTATNRAINYIRSKRPNNPRGYNRVMPARSPFLIFLRIRRDIFDAWQKVEFDENQSKEAYTQLYRFGNNGQEVVIGYLLKNNGTQIIENVPRQYKFENNGQLGWEIIGKMRLGM